MHPRLILRTHYQAHEPRIILRLVTHCASATISRHDDAIAESLRADVRSWHPKIAFSLPAAAYAIDNARSLDLLNQSNRRTATGLALSFVEGTSPESRMPSLDLTAAEGRLYLLQYLFGTGALALKFADWLLREGKVTDDQIGREGIVERLLVETLGDYLSLTSDVRERTAIRKERDRLKVTRYDDKTRRHKRRPIIATLRRLGLVELSQDGQTIHPDRAGRLARLCALVPNTESLERLAASRETLRAIVSQVYAEDSGGDSPGALEVIAAYGFASDLGLQSCPLQYLDDILFARGFPAVTGTTNGGPAERILSEIHRHKPRDVRFHVDRRGRRAFVVLTAAALQELRPQASR